MSHLGEKEAKTAAEIEATNAAIIEKAHKDALKGNPPVSVKLKRVHHAVINGSGEGYIVGEQAVSEYEQAILRPINLDQCGDLGQALRECQSSAPLVISVDGKKVEADAHIGVVDGACVLRLELPAVKVKPKAKAEE